MSTADDVCLESAKPVAIGVGHWLVTCGRDNKPREEDNEPNLSVRVRRKRCVPRR
jgi:hypothetical protein